MIGDGQINWGIIGCGDVTEVKSGPAFSRVPKSLLAAVMRRDGDKAADYARRHNVPRWYTDADKLIHDPTVNAIYIATPPSSHLDYARAAFAAGKPVYVEKPMTAVYEEALAMASAAAAGNGKLVVAHYRRQQPFFLKIRQLLKEGVIGKPLLVRLEFSRPSLTKEELANPRIAWRVDPPIAGGGLFHDLAPHQLDILYYYFGPVKQLSGIATNQGGHYAADDLVAGNILFESGVAFSGTWCFNAPAGTGTDHCEIIGTRGKISFAVFNGTEISVLADGVNALYAFDSLPHVQEPMIAATVRYFLDEGPNPCSGEEGAEVMRMMQGFVKR